MAGGTSSREEAMSKALAYIEAVREKFQGSREKFDEFKEIMIDFKYKRIQLDGLIAKLEVLFKGHRDLALGFNAYLPDDHHICLPEDERLGVTVKVECEEDICPICQSPITSGTMEQVEQTVPRQ